jgi:hypothetical protein
LGHFPGFSSIEANLDLDPLIRQGSQVVQGVLGHLPLEVSRTFGTEGGDEAGFGATRRRIPSEYDEEGVHGIEYPVPSTQLKEQ